MVTELRFAANGSPECSCQPRPHFCRASLARADAHTGKLLAVAINDRQKPKTLDKGKPLATLPLEGSAENCFFELHAQKNDCAVGFQCSRHSHFDPPVLLRFLD
jgi:hypothetical protein